MNKNCIFNRTISLELRVDREESIIDFAALSFAKPCWLRSLKNVYLHMSIFNLRSVSIVALSQKLFRKLTSLRRLDVGYLLEKHCPISFIPFIFQEVLEQSNRTEFLRFEFVRKQIFKTEYKVPNLQNLDERYSQVLEERLKRVENLLPSPKIFELRDDDAFKVLYVTEKYMGFGKEYECHEKLSNVFEPTGLYVTNAELIDKAFSS
eukprot:snap_masked-scaffold_36-processed-gene-1.35-mRNA-1 protein AED:1.00 eAED:1.00 QI:0/-1/0/0/-1/1/1/0/206